jgi:hypothetical protein
MALAPARRPSVVALRPSLLPQLPQKGISDADEFGELVIVRRALFHRCDQAFQLLRGRDVFDLGRLDLKQVF